VRRGVRRTLGTAQRQVRPVTVPDLRTMLQGLDTDPAGSRDRALLLLGFAGALRRSELVGLDVVDVTEGADGLTVRLRRSKTDQEGAGRTVGIPYGSNAVTCPVRAWLAWLVVSGITEGAVFRPADRHGHIGAIRLTAQAVALVLKRRAARAGLDPDEVPVTRCGPVLRPRPLLPESPSASSPSRRATRARRCFAATSGRTPCSVRTPPARLDCSETLSLDADGACGPYRMLLATRTR
jgi:integrase